MVSRFSFTQGRRAGERRNEGVEGIYVDQYESKVLLLILSVALFNLMDCFFTLLQLGRGATELNPFVNYLLEFGPGMFIFAKTVGIGLILSFLCIHTHFKMARATLYFALTMYLGIFIYHILVYALWT